MSWIAVAGAVVAVGSAAYQAKTAGDASAKNADAVAYQGALGKAMSELDAEAVESQTAAQVRQIKRQAVGVRATQMAQQAASGVIVGDGSAGQMIDQTEQLSSEDVLATMYSGANKAVSIRSGASLQEDASTRQANLLMDKSRAEKTAANIQLAGSLVNLGVTGYAKYNQPATGFNPATK